jgi:C4-dicarboxylate-specific signal transduction histidine kinase
MMSMIAHQWRQPLATASLMISNAQIKTMLSGKEPNESDEILEKISETLTYLSDLIDNFQTYFKPNKLPENVSAKTMIDHMENILKTRLKLENVSLHIEQARSGLFIETYASEVVQVLINIMNNAIDAQKEKHIEDRHIWLHVFDDEENFIITIEDNAGGIPKEIIKQVFDPYFSTKAKNGTGLGLYMAKMIIEKHIGGSLSVANTFKGAQFMIVIPKVFKKIRASAD